MQLLITVCISVSVDLGGEVVMYAVHSLCTLYFWLHLIITLLYQDKGLTNQSQAGTIPGRVHL